ncbi:hypothetical protein YDYSG_59200 [Paenibacillus tyrfis]|uniref:sugar nucleotide-binding protein n=1 Tax=Paenibacillus tyrfis TaxID=1501230 RepID=UPI00248FE7AA|nr:sugar nucleotide-binding protein [Paenibacillus tyrfis]GLI09887.1 hypothetical protein YDYSG_59200 [Paenibacillus tyrfis]
MKSALIGYTGFVGTTLSNQTTFDDYYNSKNIAEIQNKHYKMVICAGAPAVKWKANQDPVQDLENINSLISHLKTIQADEFILISTVDVYKSPNNVDENTIINPDDLDPYGKHRFFLEQFVREKFDNHFIIRLPGLFGRGLKKNFIYDMIHDNCLHLTHHKSIFQFYDMSRLWSDITFVKKQGFKVINFSTEPVSASEIVENCFNKNFNNVTDKAPVNYNMKSIYSEHFNLGELYMTSKKETYFRIREFIRMETTSK